MPSGLIPAGWRALSVRSGTGKPAAIAQRITRLLPLEDIDAVRLAARFYIQFDEFAIRDLTALTAFVLDQPELKNAFARNAIRAPVLEPAAMGTQSSALVTFPLPDLSSMRDVGLWLSLFDHEVEWFADRQSRQRAVTKPCLHHYRYAWIKKRSGGLRLIEAPKSRLKTIQRSILHGILNRVPPHPAAHGFCRGRTIKTFVAPHLGQQSLLRLDLKDFFVSVPVPRVSAVFRSLGYPADVAWLLQGLCTTCMSPALAGDQINELAHAVRERLQSKHLPQGAPSSPALANLCAWHLDCRLQGLADRYELQYTRYADDLAFSGPSSALARRADFLESMVGAIAIEEGFCLNHRKTRLRQSSQRQSLAGVVVNTKYNMRRCDWDLLKATLHNCVRYGPATQNRHEHKDFKAHLAGRLAHATWLNKNRATKLQALWQQIDWDD